MAFDAFVKIDQVPGESTDEKHPGWIEILSYSLGVVQPATGSASSGGARSAERPDFNDITIVKTLDKASPKIFQKCADGTHFNKVEIELCRATGNKECYQKYTLSHVLVTSFSTGGSSQGGENLPIEECSFNFGKIETLYTETDHKTGAPGAKHPAGHDCTTNKTF